MKEKERKGFGLIKLVIAVIVLGGAGYFVFGSFIKPKQNETLRVGFTGEMMEALTVAALENELFKENGLEVSLKYYPTGKFALEEGLLSGQVDIAAAAVTPVITNFIDGSKIRIISVLGRGNEQMRLIAKKSSNISSQEDLKGKKIGTQKSSAAHYYLYLFLDYNKIKSSEVEIVFVDPDKAVESIVDGTIDALIIREPYISEAAKILGDDAVLFPFDSAPYKTFVYVTTDTFAKRNPEIIKNFLNAVLKAQNFIDYNNQDAKTMFENYQDVSKTQVARQWGQTNWNVVIDEALVLDLLDQGSWAMASDLTKNKISLTRESLRDLIYTDALRAIKPGSVTFR